MYIIALPDSVNIVLLLSLLLHFTLCAAVPVSSFFQYLRPEGTGRPPKQMNRHAHAGTVLSNADFPLSSFQISYLLLRTHSRHP